MPPDDASARLVPGLERILGAAVESLTFGSGGYSPALRALARLADGRSVFAKMAVDRATASWLRSEHRVYEVLDGSFSPGMHGFLDGEYPLLVLDDLSAARWPPPFENGDVGRVLATLNSVSTAARPASLPHARNLVAWGELWRRSDENAAALIELGMFTMRWWREAYPVLSAAADPRLLEGDALLHCDVRSDNLCFAADERTMPVDWNWASCGAAELDTAFRLPSLRLDGDPRPAAIADIDPGYVSLVAGYFAQSAVLPEIPEARCLRDSACWVPRRP